MTTEQTLAAIKREIFADVNVDKKRNILMAYGISRDRAEHATYDADTFWQLIESTGPLDGYQLPLWIDIAPDAYSKLNSYFEPLRSVAPTPKSSAISQPQPAATLSNPHLLKRKVALLDLMQKSIDRVSYVSDGNCTKIDAASVMRLMTEVVDAAKKFDQLDAIQRQFDRLRGFFQTACVRAHADRKRELTATATTAAVEAPKDAAVDSASADGAASLPSAKFTQVITVQNIFAMAAAVGRTEDINLLLGPITTNQSAVVVPRDEAPVQSSSPLTISNNQERADATAYLNEYLAAGAYSSAQQTAEFRRSFTRVEPIAELHDFPVNVNTFGSNPPSTLTMHHRRYVPSTGAFHAPWDEDSNNIGYDPNYPPTNEHRRTSGMPRRFAALMDAHRLEYEFRCERCNARCEHPDKICFQKLLADHEYLCVNCAKCFNDRCRMQSLPKFDVDERLIYRRNEHYVFVEHDSNENLVMQITFPNDADTLEFSIKGHEIGVFRVRDDSMISFRRENSLHVWGSRRTNQPGGFFMLNAIYPGMGGNVDFQSFGSMDTIDWIIAYKHFKAYKPTFLSTTRSNNNTTHAPTMDALGGNNPFAPQIMRPYRRYTTSSTMPAEFGSMSLGRSGDFFLRGNTDNDNARSNNNNSFPAAGNDDSDILANFARDSEYLKQERKFFADRDAQQRDALLLSRNPPGWRRQPALSSVARSTYSRNIDESTNLNNYNEFFEHGPSYFVQHRPQTASQPAAVSVSVSINEIRQQPTTQTPLPIATPQPKPAPAAKKTPLPVADDGDGNHDDECTICLDAAAIMKNSNCSHTIMCSDCAVAYIQKKTADQKDASCPLCRAAIVDLLLDTKRITTMSTKRPKTK